MRNHTRSSLLGLALLVLLGVGLFLGALFVAPTPSQAGQAQVPDVSGPINMRLAGTDGPYSYLVGEKRNHKLEMVVAVDYDNAQTSEQYRQANIERSNKLIKEGRKGNVPVTVTFSRPLSWEEISSLVSKTELQPEYYIFVGFRGHEKFTLSVTAAYTPTDQAARTISDQQGSTLRGVMVLKGTVPPTQESLGALTDDPRVFVADTTAQSVLDAVQADARLQGKEIGDVVLPSPFWNMPWDGPTIGK